MTTTPTVSAPPSTRPRVSVIVPVLNGIRTIRPCLESLAALQQAHPDVEVLVVDNGSTDGTPDVVREFPTVQLLMESAVRGPSAARNAGAHAARGDVLAFTDADCVVTSAWLREALPRFQDPEVVGVGGAIEGVTPTNAIQQWMNDRRILDQEAALRNEIKPYLQTANAFFRRQAVLDVDGFDPSLPYGEDCDLSWRIQEATGGRLAYAPDALVYHDHRCSLRGLRRQSAKNAMAAAYLARKWGTRIPRKHWKISVWEVRDLVAHGTRRLRLWLGRAPAPVRFQARLDFLHRWGRKWGQLKAAWKTGQWRYW